MPIYEYQCKTCGRKLEKRQKFSDAPLTVCPHCSGPLEQLISAPAVQFKGGGWFADGYGSRSSAKSESSSEGGTAASSSSESGGSGSSSGDSGGSAKSSGSSSDSSSSSSAASTSSSTPAASSTATSKS